MPHPNLPSIKDETPGRPPRNKQEKEEEEGRTLSFQIQKATNFSERKVLLAEFTKVSSANKIGPDDFIKVCQIYIKDAEASLEVIKLIGNLANGLGNCFSESSRSLLPVLLKKLKDKRRNVNEALTQTLQAFYKFECLTLVDAIEDIRVAIKHKLPRVRSSTLNWVTFCIEASDKETVLKLHKDYVPICMESLNDGTPEVRDAAFATLAAIAKSVGLRPLHRSLETLDHLRRKKLARMIPGSTYQNMNILRLHLPNVGADDLVTVTVKNISKKCTSLEFQDTFYRFGAASTHLARQIGHVQLPYRCLDAVFYSQIFFHGELAAVELFHRRESLKPNQRQRQRANRK